MISNPIIRIQKDQRVAILSLKEPNGSLYPIVDLANQLSVLRTAIMSIQEIRVVVVVMDVGFSEFIMGDDLLMQTEKANVETFCQGCSLGEHLARIDCPVIVAVMGNAIGIGLEMALTGDIRIAAETSCFGLPHISLGLIPCDGGTQRLPRVVGKAKALEMLFTGAVIDAQEALRIGLVNKIVTPQELLESALDMANTMASKAPLSLRYAKESICKGMDLNLEQGLRLETDLYLLLHTTHDRTKGIKAFQQRQKAQFGGT
jgi:enoyl-CoA hydratase/carnithine racemase